MSVLLIILLASLPTAGITAVTAERLTFSLDEQKKADQARDGYVVLGDMAFREEDIRSGGVMIKRWPNGRVPIAFQAAATPSQRSAFLTACAAWGVGTSVRCVERTSESAYIQVVEHNGEACGGNAYVSCSLVGMLGSAPQPLWIYSTHWAQQRVLQHELGHALGLVHEHSRPDRESYVIINRQNIKPGMEHNFAIYVGASPLTDYDYISNMHYRNCAFSIHEMACNTETEALQTITPRACHLAGALGGNTVTTLDMDGMRRMYGGTLATSLPVNRRSECGTLEYSQTQVDLQCGLSCAAAQALPTKRVETVIDTWCGTMTIQPDPDDAFCRSRVNKDFLSFRWDQEHHCGFLDLEVKSVRLTQCGCPVSELTSACSVVEAIPDREVIGNIMENGDTIDRRSAKLLAAMMKKQSAGKIDSDVSANVVPFLIENRSIDGASWRLLLLRYRIWWGTLFGGSVDNERVVRNADAVGLDASVFETESVATPK